jgi:hypothetical protein
MATSGASTRQTAALTREAENSPAMAVTDESSASGRRAAISIPG